MFSWQEYRLEKERRASVRETQPALGERRNICNPIKMANSTWPQDSFCPEYESRHRVGSIAGLDGKYMKFKSDSINFWQASWEAGMKFQGCSLRNLGMERKGGHTSYFILDKEMAIVQHPLHQASLLIPPLPIHAKFWWSFYDGLGLTDVAPLNRHPDIW